MFLAKISGSDRTFKVNKIAEFLDKSLNAEQQLYKLLQRIHEESKVLEGEKLNFFKSLIKNSSIYKE